MNSLDSMNRPSQPCFNRVRFDGQGSTGFAETLLSRKKIGPIRKLLKPLDPALNTALPEQCAPAPAFDSPDERIIPIAVGRSGNAEETGTTSQLRLLRLGCSLNRIRYRVYLFRFSPRPFFPSTLNSQQSIHQKVVSPNDVKDHGFLSDGLNSRHSAALLCLRHASCVVRIGSCRLLKVQVDDEADTPVIREISEEARRCYMYCTLSSEFDR